MNRYFEQMILSASPVELIRLLYQQAMMSVRDAREHLRTGRIPERCASTMRAYRVLAELMNSVRPGQSPELGARLCGLYAYMQQRLLEACFEQSDEPLAEVLDLLSSLAEAWSEVPEIEDHQPKPKQSWNPAGFPRADPARVALTA